MNEIISLLIKIILTGIVLYCGSLFWGAWRIKKDLQHTLAYNKEFLHKLVKQLSTSNFFNSVPQEFSTIGKYYGLDYISNIEAEAGANNKSIKQLQNITLFIFIIICIISFFIFPLLSIIQIFIFLIPISLSKNYEVEVKIVGVISAYAWNLYWFHKAHPEKAAQTIARLSLLKNLNEEILSVATE
jgi:hypothetical protein